MISKFCQRIAAKIKKNYCDAPSKHSYKLMQIRAIGRATPQGGVLSSLLWDLVAHWLLVILEQNWCEVIAYADDIVLVVSGRFVNTINDRMQLALRSVCMWESDRGWKQATDFSYTEIKWHGTETRTKGTLSRAHPGWETVFEIEYHWQNQKCFQCLVC